MKLFLGRAVWREVTVEHSECWDDLLLLCRDKGIYTQRATVKGDALVSRARSILASAFLRSQCDVLLTLDADIWFRPQDALRLAEKCYRDKDIIGALYMTRNLATQPALLLPDRPVRFDALAAPELVPFVSTGFMAVGRRVIQKLAGDLPLCHQTWRDRGRDSSFWPFYMPYCIPCEGDGHMYLSEDWAFCQRAKDAGFQVWVDPSIRLGHVGSYLYTLEDLIRPERSQPGALVLQRHEDGALETIVPIAEKVSTR